MGRRVINYFFIWSVLNAFSCASSGSASQGSGGDNYYEDLAQYRPEVEVVEDTVSAEKAYNEDVDYNLEPKYDVTREVNALLDSILVLRQAVKYVDGFSVQVYTGINREQANEARAKVYTVAETLKPTIIYDQPNFKVKVGQFYTRREAQKLFADLRNVFPAAIITPERIPID